MVVGERCRSNRYNRQRIRLSTGCRLCESASPRLPLTLRQGRTVKLILVDAMPKSPNLYRIGDVALRTGLTIRALRHYDAIGLLTPARRSESGQRLYATRDLVRLQRIVSLRALGLSLADIADALDRDNPTDLIRRHVAHLRARIESDRQALDRLERVAKRLRGWHSDDEDVFTFIHISTMIDQHYTPEQLAQLERRGHQVGDEQMRAVQQQWATLFERFDAHRQAGDDPASTEVQSLVTQAQTLIGQFTGGDAGVRSSLDGAVQHIPDEMYRAWGISPELGAYYGSAMAASAG